MRKKYLAGAIAGLILVCIDVVAQGDCGCGGMSNRSYRSLSGSPCFSPPGCSMTPGCCECPPSACDNAWEGYCQHKAKVQAFFTKVGTPRTSYYYGNRGNCGSPTPAVREISTESVPSTKPAAGPEAAKPPMPPDPPTPDKTSRANVLYPWLR